MKNQSPRPEDMPVVISKPRQAWARLDGLENLAPLYQPITTDQILTRLCVQDAFARLGMAFDECLVEVIRSLFTSDASVSGAIGTYKPGGEIIGRETIVKIMTAGINANDEQRRHIISNIVLTSVAKNSASALAYGAIIGAGDKLYMNASSIYSAELCCESDGIWRFSKLIVGVDHYAGPHAPTLNRF